MFIIITHMLHCIFQMIPSGQVWRCVILYGKPVYLSYDGRKTRRIAQEHVTQVLMQPDICFLMREQELGLLHVGSKSTRADAVVVPFDIGDDQKLLDLVLIIPLGYLPTDLQELQRLDIQHRSGLHCMVEFQNSTHFWFKSMSLDCMLVMLSYTLDKNIPLVITLTADQN